MAELTAKSKKKKILLIAIVVIVIVAGIYFYMQGSKGEEKKGEINGNISTVGYPYTHETPNETDSKKANGDTKSTKLTRDSFDLKVMKLVKDAKAEAAGAGWIITQAAEFQTQFWTPHYGMDEDEAIYYTARSFIGETFYHE